MLRNVVFSAPVRRHAGAFVPFVRPSSTSSSSSSSSSSSKRTESSAASQAAATQASNERDRAEKENDAVVATQVGALANVGLAGTKGIIGYGVNSTALMADAANSLGDLLIDAVVYYTIKGTLPLWLSLPLLHHSLPPTTFVHPLTLYKRLCCSCNTHHRPSITEARKKATPAHPWGRGKVTNQPTHIHVLSSIRSASRRISCFV